MEPYLRVMLNTLVAFTALFIIAKLSGKKQISQLEVVDYVVAISLGSIAASLTYEIETDIIFFLIAMGVFTIMTILFSLVSRKATFLKYILNGKPIILIDDGKIDFKNLLKSRLDINELLALCRMQGFFDLNDIAYAIMEFNGQLSILPAASAAPATAKDTNTVGVKPSLSTDMIMDGKIIDKALNQAAKDRQWLFNRFGVQKEKELKNILLATYDSEKDALNVHYKNK